MVSRKDRKGSTDAYELLFRALAHPVRRRILMTLNFEGGAMTAGEIAAIFEHAWPTTTRHLKVLENAGCLRHERNGRSRLYRLDPRTLQLARDWLDWFARDPSPAPTMEREAAR